MLFAVMEQRRVSRDAIDDLGRPNFDRMNQRRRASQNPGGLKVGTQVNSDGTPMAPRAKVEGDPQVKMPPLKVEQRYLTLDEVTIVDEQGNPIDN